jgi:hypothetical protein
MIRVPGLLALAAFVLLAPAAAPAEDATEKKAELPPGVVARVHGRDVTEADLRERLAKRWATTERGKQLLDQLIDDLCVEAEAATRSVTVTDDEVAAYVKRIDETIRRQTGGTRTIEDVYREENSTPAEFALIAREYVKRQKMAAEDLGGKAGDEVPEARLKLWLSSLRRRSGVKVTDLPPGVLAKVGDVVIDRARFAEALAKRLPEDAVHSARDDLVFEAATEHALAAAKVEVQDADVDAELARIRERFAQDPRVKNTGLTFDEFLRQTRGTSEAELRADRAFRSRIGLERMLRERISDEDVRKTWEENRDAFGERALVRQIYIPAGDSGGKFKMRSFEQAFELVLRAKAAVLEGTGLPGTPAEGRRPLRDVVTAVAKQFEEDPEKRKAAGEPVAWTRASLSGQEKLLEDVFKGETGKLLGPTRSLIGWHLVLVEERRPAPSFEEVSDAVRDDLLRRATAKFQLSIRTDPGVIVR